MVVFGRKGAWNHCGPRTRPGAQTFLRGGAKAQVKARHSCAAENETLNQESDDVKCRLGIPYRHFTAVILLRRPTARGGQPATDGSFARRLTTWWRAFGRMGHDLFCYLTNWVTLASFKSCQLYSQVPDLPRREQRTC